MSDFADAHQGGIVIVRHEGSMYAAGYRANCSCGWVASDIRERESTCPRDLQAHLTEALTATKETA